MKKNTLQSKSRFNLMTLLSALLAAVAASLCCVGPFVLMMLGFGGSWMANLAIFEPYRPVFITITTVFVLLAFRKLYLLPIPADHDRKLATNLKKQRIMFWLICLLLVALITFPYYGQIFY